MFSLMMFPVKKASQNMLSKIATKTESVALRNKPWSYNKKLNKILNFQVTDFLYKWMFINDA